MIDVRINAPAIEHLEIDGEIGIVASEIASVCALYYAELKKHDDGLASHFQAFMRRLVEEDSPLWRCPPVNTSSELIAIPKL